MTNYNQLESMRKEVLSKFSKDELKHYINQLSKRYYASFMNNDGERHNSINSEFYDIISIFEDTYPSIKSYINYCLLKSANDLLQNSFQRNFTLKCLSIDIDESEKSDVTINLLEKVKEKRKELKDLKNGNDSGDN